MERAKPGRLTPADAAGQRLRIDYATAEVLEAFEAEGIDSTLLKGATVVRWLYEPQERRAYVDSDLMVAPTDFDAAGAVLRDLGFEPEIEDADMPDWWREHGVSWFREADQVAVDLHRTLAGAVADPETVWGVLSEDREPFEVGGREARALSLPGRALNLALHVAHHGGGSTRQVDELERAITIAGDDVWCEAARLAARIDATASFGTGLRFAPSGGTLAERLGLSAHQPVEVALQAAGTVDALTLERFANAGPRARLAIARHKIAPPRTFMRKWSPLARRGPLGLALAYVWRPLWLAGRAPRVFKTWRAARRAPRGGS